MRAAMTNAVAFYSANMFRPTEETEAVINARKYVDGRWGLDFARSEEIGFAPASWDSLYKWVQEKGHPVDIFIELGLLVRKGERIYDFSGTAS